MILSSTSILQWNWTSLYHNRLHALHLSVLSQLVCWIDETTWSTAPLKLNYMHM
jgi:hypothetical protein